MRRSVLFFFLIVLLRWLLGFIFMMNSHLHTFLEECEFETIAGHARYSGNLFKPFIALLVVGEETAQEARERLLCIIIIIQVSFLFLWNTRTVDRVFEKETRFRMVLK